MRDKNLDAYQDQDDTPEEARLQPTGDGQTETARKRHGLLDGVVS